MDEHIEKYHTVKSYTATDEDLAKINALALEPITADEIFTFKMELCSNQADDRDYEPFTANALKDLAPLFAGKTVIQDHDPSAKKQVARIYDTEIVTDSEVITYFNEPLTRLIGKCYMVKIDENAGLISEIKAGIKKEVSVSCSVTSKLCSICGVDNIKTQCNHIRGQKYAKNDAESVCMKLIESCSDAYEVSFVAVPAQPNAGTCKQMHGTKEIYRKKKALQLRLDLSLNNYEKR